MSKYFEGITVMGAKMRPHEAHALVLDADLHLLFEPKAAGGVGIAAAEYLQVIHDEINKDSEGHTEPISMGKAIWLGAAAMSNKYGEPELDGMPSPMAPVNVETAKVVQQGVHLVRAHIEAAFAAQPQQ